MPASDPADFALRKYRPHAQTAVLPVAELTALAPSDGVEKPLQNLGDLVDQVFEKSNGEINNLIDEFEQLRRKLKERKY